MATNYMLFLDGSNILRFNLDGTFKDSLHPYPDPDLDYIQPEFAQYWSADYGVCTANGVVHLFNGEGNYPHIIRRYKADLSDFDSEFGPPTSGDNEFLHVISGTAACRVGTEFHKPVNGYYGDSYTVAGPGQFAVAVIDATGNPTGVYLPGDTYDQIAATSDDASANHTVIMKAESVYDGEFKTAVRFHNYLHPDAESVVVLPTGMDLGGGAPYIRCVAADKTSRRAAVFEETYGPDSAYRAIRLTIFDTDTLTVVASFDQAAIDAAYPDFPEASIGQKVRLPQGADFDANGALWFRALGGTSVQLLRLDNTGNFQPAIDPYAASGIEPGSGASCLFAQAVPPSVLTAGPPRSRMFKVA